MGFSENHAFDVCSVPLKANMQPETCLSSSQMGQAAGWAGESLYWVPQVAHIQQGILEGQQPCYVYAVSAGEVCFACF